MALVPIRITRTSKPPAGTPIDWTHPHNRAVVGAWAFNEFVGNLAINAANDKNPLIATGSCVLTPNGAYNNGDTASNFSSKITAPECNEISLVMRIKRLGATAQYSPVAYNNDNSLGPVWYLRNESATDVGSLTFLINGQTGTTVVTANNILPVGIFVDLAVVAKGNVATIYADGKQVSTATGTATTPYRPSTQPFAVIGRYSSSATYKAALDNFIFFNRALTAAEIASLSANPWQIYEPETLWINTAGGTGYSDTLVDLATAYDSVTDIATFLDAGTTLITAGVTAEATIQLLDSLLTDVAAADTISDTVLQVEALLATIQAAATVADAQAAVEQLAETITAADELTDSISGAAVENLTTTVQAAADVADVVAALDTFHTAIQATVTVTDELINGLAENLLTTATAIDSVTDLQLMVDNLTIMAQSQVSLTEINDYLEQLVTAATVQASVTDILVGAFVGRYIFSDLASPRRFADLATPRRFLDYCSPRGHA